MLAPSPAPAEQPPRLVTEAEAVANLLLDMDVPLTARLDSPDLLFQVSTNTPSGAVDVMRIAIDRFEKDAEFRDDMITYLGSAGDYVAGAPGIAGDFAQASAASVVATLGAANLLLHCHGSGHDRNLTFEPIDNLPANAHLLISAVRTRFHRNPDFASALAHECADREPS